MSVNSCYCCSHKSGGGTTSGARMDLDAALNELGMLSSVTDSRRQFVAERSRSRHINSSPDTSSGACATPSNSPNKGTYQIVQINPQFVTSLSSGISSMEVKQSVVQDSCGFGTVYMDSFEKDTKSNRVSRNKVTQLRRFRKPYEIPWLQQHKNDAGMGGETSRGGNTSVSEDVFSAGNLNINKPLVDNTPVAKPDMYLSRTPEESQLACRPTSSSNVSTPEKNVNITHGVPRSKSLDDLDFAKLRLADFGTRDFPVKRRDIDNVSKDLQNLNVND